MPEAPHGAPHDAPGSLRGIGVDAERIARFEKLAAGGRPWRHVFTPREAEHLAAQPCAAVAFCAAFCSKEALCKGLGTAYPFRLCECFYLPGERTRDLVLSPELGERHGLSGVRLHFHEGYPGERGECVVEAQLFGGRVGGGKGGGSAAGAGPAPNRGVLTRLESFAIAGVESDRPRLEALHFSPAELDDLGGRRVQSLAGAFALKLALAALAAGAAPQAAPAKPRDFELGHLASGAPRLVRGAAGLAPAAVCVSIAHTREWAYGLAGSPEARLLY